MRAVVQRVRSAAVEVADEVVAQIGGGLLVLVGVTHDDDESKSDRMAERIWHLRVFEDPEGRMNLSASELGKPVLVVSQFTLYADTSRGRRPSFVNAATPEHAEPLVRRVTEALAEKGCEVATGRFGAKMAVELTNDGPLTILLEV